MTQPIFNNPLVAAALAQLENDVAALLGEIAVEFPAGSELGDGIVAIVEGSLDLGQCAQDIAEELA